MDFKYTINSYDNLDNEYKDKVLDFMLEYNEKFSDYDLSLEEQVNKWFTEDEKDKLKGKEAMEVYYESLCDELVITLHEGEVIACRFVEYDKDDNYFKDRVEDYEIGLHLTFALVDEKYRNEGIWSKMLEHVEKEILPDYPVDRLYLATTSKNNKMQGAAKSNGFSEVGRSKNERGEGIDAIIYCKQI